jgi:hypothetical protein
MNKAYKHIELMESKEDAESQEFWLTIKLAAAGLVACVAMIAVSWLFTLTCIAFYGANVCEV